MKHYTFKAGSRIHADPDEAAQVMNELASEDKLTAENLVEVSRPEDAPLHDEFEWDDSIAAQEYRKEQGRSIIRSLVIVPETEDAQPVRAFFQIEETGSTYTPIDVIVRCPTKREQLLTQAYTELKAFRKKYESLSELTDVFDAIDDTFNKEERKWA